ncbi:MAG: alanine racemase [Deltaproteobacteria bacterium]|nr:alanine racemase [Deltaproteobacteria bacterium]
MEKRPTSAIIDMEALRHNYRQLRAKLPRAAKMMAIVKANAYGHGDVRTAGLLEGLGCEFFGVAIAEEGARLREGGIKAPVVVLGGIFPRQVKELFAFGLTPVVFDMETARRIDSFAREAGIVKKIHVKIDTGMGRLGLLPAQAAPFFTELKALGNISVEAVLSHFSESEASDRDFSKKQLAAFLETIDAIRALGFDPGLVEIANSAAAASFPEARLDLVRPGIMLYGSYPAPHLRGAVALKPVMKLRTEILSLKTLDAGSPVSYGRSFVTKRRSVIATLPIGYGDGLPRGLSNKGAVLVRGARAPIVGAVCMDLTMCDVTGIPGASPGDEAVIIGAQGEAGITAEEVASTIGTISYEVFCGISSRVPRVYI